MAAQRPVRAPKAVRIGLLVVLVGLVVAWLGLQGDGNAAATPVLVVGVVVSAACALLSAAGKL